MRLNKHFWLNVRLTYDKRVERRNSRLKRSRGFRPPYIYLESAIISTKTLRHSERLLKILTPFLPNTPTGNRSGRLQDFGRQYRRPEFPATGVCAWIRHPMHLGFMLFLLAFFLPHFLCCRCWYGSGSSVSSTVWRAARSET